MLKLVEYITKKIGTCRKTCAIFFAVRTSKLFFLTALHRPRIRGHKFLTAHRIGPLVVSGPFLQGPNRLKVLTQYELIRHTPGWSGLVGQLRINP